MDPKPAIFADDQRVAPVLDALKELFPQNWKVQPETDPVGAADSGRSDLVVTVEDGRSFGRLVVDVKRSLAPRDVDPVVERLQLMRRLDLRVEYLIAAPWLSPTTRARLTAGGVHYLDLTGNASIRMEHPAVFVRTDGAAQDPSPQESPSLTLKGQQAGRLVRALVDYVPPYTASAIASAARISVSYASRQLAELDREALVQRDRRGGVIDRDWAGLLRARARYYGLLTTNRASGYIASTGARELAGQLTSRSPGIRAITGSFAASRIAPVAAPAQLMIYVDEPSIVAEYYSLLPADSGADVVLLQPFDNEVVYERAVPDPDSGLARLAISQLTLDCLSGNGRMPAEGEALLEWMATRSDEWQSALARKARA